MEADIDMWLDESDGDVGDLSLGSDSDRDHASVEELSEHDTESEQEADEQEQMQFRSMDNQPFVLGKDNVTKWFLHCPQQGSRVRTRHHNIVTERFGLQGEAKNCHSPLEAWKLFFNDDTIQSIVTNTNKYLEKIRPKYRRGRDCKETNPDELLSFIGLLYLSGVLKSSHVNLQDLWKKDITTPNCFRMTMGINRFKILLRSLRFDDIDTRLERKRTDRLAPVRELFDGFVQCCIKSYKPGNNCTIDEMLEGFFGRCPFKQYIPSKPNKYGIKIFSLVDSKTFLRSAWRSMLENSLRGRLGLITHHLQW
uniref:PiggyBac transposable element-derived protein domain-containing protein n=1 Tax=Graphocephala atropunctata TaxID=36148 RepID=A0A1B6LU83_9HEMI